MSRMRNPIGFRVYDKGAGGGTARFRPDLVADERVPDDHGRRNAAPAHGPACRECEIRSDFAFTTKARAVALRDFGPTLSPMNAFLTITGVETLHLRMDRHVENAKSDRISRLRQRRGRWHCAISARPCRR